MYKYIFIYLIAHLRFPWNILLFIFCKSSLNIKDIKFFVILQIFPGLFFFESCLSKVFFSIL